MCRHIYLNNKDVSSYIFEKKFFEIFSKIMVIVRINPSEKETPKQVFPYEYCKNFNNSFLTPLVAAYYLRGLLLRPKEYDYEYDY